MLKAAKSRWFEHLFAIYNRNLFRRRFNSFCVLGLENIVSDPLPLLLYANHSSWWDGLVAFEISRRARLDAYVMMEERQLSRLRLFRKLGAFSVVREDPRDAYRSVEYAAGLLREGAAVWMFPQGEIRPAGKRPLGFYPGIARVIRKADLCKAVPVAIRYEFKGEFKPDVFVRIGTGDEMRGTLRNTELVQTLENRLELELVEIASDLNENRLESYEGLI